MAMEPALLRWDAAVGLLLVIPVSLSARGQAWLRFITLQIDLHGLSIAPQSMLGKGNAAAAAAQVLSVSLAGLCVPGSCGGWIGESGGTALPLCVSPVPSPRTRGLTRPGECHVPSATTVVGPCCRDRH